MQKVNAVKLNSANVKYDNSVDTERVYDLECDVNIYNGEAGSLDAGVVKMSGVQVASFSYYDGDRKTLNFNGLTEEDECKVLSAVNAFVADVKNSVKTTYTV